MKTSDARGLQEDVIMKCAIHSKTSVAIRQFMMMYRHMGKPMQSIEKGKLHVPEEQTIYKYGLNIIQYC